MKTFLYYKRDKDGVLFFESQADGSLLFECEANTQKDADSNFVAQFGRSLLAENILRMIKIPVMGDDQSE